MNEWNPSGMNDTGRAENNADGDEVSVGQRDPEDTMGALELEYPSGAGLYGEVFDRYVAEVADMLVDTRAVRVLVELEFNVRLAHGLLGGISEGLTEDLVLVRREIETLLWDVCDVLAAEYRKENWTDSASVKWESAYEKLE